MERPFTSGSRQAPDPFDQFLEGQGFYRKHTARDASCLFRTLSEQIYDTQIHHVQIRERIVKYMHKHKSYFMPAIDINVDDYLDDMSKQKTFGSLLELQAASFVFEKNILLFEAFNTGTWFQCHKTNEGVIRVFYTPERHFDSVFTSNFIRDAAFAQALVYEILYKHVFKLPDVKYAVEQMLHSVTSDSSYYVEQFSGEFCTKLALKDGREFNLDTPENTSCILNDSKLCHFHNKQFTQFAKELDWELNHVKGSMDADERRLTRTMDSLLPQKYISCVRQLLSAGITPFPYKVAKALDPYMYRNIEFDSWNEMRKENRMSTWYNGGSSNLGVGVKCHVKLSNSQLNFYTCHIQDISPEKGPCVVFIEELGEKRIVPFEFLKPLPPDLCKPWTMPIRLQRQMERQTYRMRYRGTSYRERHDFFCYDSLKSDYFDDFSKHDHDAKKDIYSISEFTDVQHFRGPPIEYCAMPLTIDLDRNGAKNSDSNGRAQSLSSEVPTQDNQGSCEVQAESLPPDYDQYQQCQFNCPDSYLSNYQYENNMVQGGPPGPNSYFYVCNAPPCQPISNEYGGPNMPSPSNGVGVSNYYLAHATNVNPPIRRGQGQLTPLSTRINVDVKKSTKLNGSDLPTDIGTLRYFFNLGIDYRIYLTRSGRDSKMHKLTNEMSNINIEDSEQKNDLNNNEDYNQKYNVANNNNNNNNQNPTYQRKYQSRNFNRRDRPQNNNRFQNNDRRYGSNDSNKKGNNACNNGNINGNGNDNSSVNSQNSSTQIIKHSLTSNNIPNSNFMSSNVVSEQCNQTTSMVSVDNSESSEFSQQGQIYNQPHPPIAYGQFVPIYPNEYSEHTQMSPGLFMPVPPPQYGMYPVQQVMTAGQPMHTAGGYQTFMAPPPPPPPQAVSFSTPYPSQAPMHPTYYSPTAEQAAVTFFGSSDVIDPNHYPYVNCQPLYYSTSNSGGTTPIIPGSTAPVPPAQGFWCIPQQGIGQPMSSIPIIPTSSATNNTGQMYPSSNNPSANLNNISH